MRYDVFICGDNGLEPIAEGASGRIRIDNVDYEDVCTIVDIADRYGLTTLAFLSTDEEG